ncbi:MAG: MBL fold metallo-hydrolase [Dehalococcoidia bacterium]|nr:MBL fold metallo-hydrolase [Dehalococcoidia bacterium]
MRQISTNVFVNVDWEGPNLGLIVTGEGNVLVDSPDSPTEAVAWRKEVEKKGEVKYLINTDGHPDHFHGNYFLPGTVIASEGARDVILQTTPEEVLDRIKNVDPAGVPLMSGYKVKVPTITFKKGPLFLHLGDQVIHCFFIGGHSPNLIAIHIPREKVIFFGDNVVHKHKTRLHEADPQEWLDSLKLLENMDVDVIVPGHGHDVCGRDYISEQASIVRAWMDAVQSAIKQGWSLEEAREKVKCPDPYATSKRSPNVLREIDEIIITRLYNYFLKTDFEVPHMK